jgi:SAM-dependent methyltransferase
MTWDALADAYDAARPGYPAALFDEIEAQVGPWRGRRVIEGGAGTGRATKALLERGAQVVAFDRAALMIERLVRNAPDALVVRADGNRWPFADAAADACVFAQCWHWFDPESAVAEAARVLRAGGAWVGCWNHPRADGDPWFEEYLAALEAGSVYRREVRDLDWGAPLARLGPFAVAPRIVVPWTRRLTVEAWLADQRSSSYVGLLSDDARERLMTVVEAVLRREFGAGEMRVPYETWCWVAFRDAAANGSDA